MGKTAFVTILFVSIQCFLVAGVPNKSHAQWEVLGPVAWALALGGLQHVGGAIMEQQLHDSGIKLKDVEKIKRLLADSTSAIADEIRQQFKENNLNQVRSHVITANRNLATYYKTRDEESLRNAKTNIDDALSSLYLLDRQGQAIHLFAEGLNIIITSECIALFGAGYADDIVDHLSNAAIPQAEKYNKEWFKWNRARFGAVRLGFRSRPAIGTYFTYTVDGHQSRRYATPQAATEARNADIKSSQEEITKKYIQFSRNTIETWIRFMEDSKKRNLFYYRTMNKKTMQIRLNQIKSNANMWASPEPACIDTKGLEKYAKRYYHYFYSGNGGIWYIYEKSIKDHAGLNKKIKKLQFHRLRRWEGDKPVYSVTQQSRDEVSWDVQHIAFNPADKHLYFIRNGKMARRKPHLSDPMDIRIPGKKTRYYLKIHGPEYSTTGLWNIKKMAFEHSGGLFYITDKNELQYVKPVGYDNEKKRINWSETSVFNGDYTGVKHILCSVDDYLYMLHENGDMFRYRWNFPERKQGRLIGRQLVRRSWTGVAHIVLADW